MERAEIQRIAEEVATQIVDTYHNPINVEYGLAESMGEEFAAVKFYERRAHEAYKEGDIMTKMLYTQKAGEEANHFIDFMNRLTEIKKSYETGDVVKWQIKNVLDAVVH
jgi:rubrerythrin